MKYSLLFLLLTLTHFVSAQSKPQSTETNTKSNAETITGDIYKVVGQMPRFPGCEDLAVTNKEKRSCANEKMLAYIYENLVYPDSARIKGIEGMAVLQFIVKKDGSIANVKVVRDLCVDCGKAAITVIESMNDLPERWIPGKKGEQPVHVQMTLPIRFKLDD